MRVIRLIILLCDTRVGVTIPQLGADLGVSERTIDRYLRAVKKEFGDSFVSTRQPDNFFRYRLIGTQAKLIAEAAYA